MRIKVGDELCVWTATILQPPMARSWTTAYSHAAFEELLKENPNHERNGVFQWYMFESLGVHLFFQPILIRHIYL